VGSIDNDDSLGSGSAYRREARPHDQIKVLVAVADVDALVTNGTALDDHARHNTTSVYTAPTIFPMLPESFRPSDLSKLQRGSTGASRRMVIGGDGTIWIRTSTGRWSAIRPGSPITVWPPGWKETEWCGAMAAVNGLEENLRLQDRAAPKAEGLPTASRGP